LNSYYVYIIKNLKNTVLYTGIPNNLFRRMEEHKSGLPTVFLQNINA